VVLAGPDRARFLEVFMGQSREYEDLTMMLPGLGPAQGRAVAEKLDGLARNQEFSRIVVGAGAEASQLLASSMRTVLQQNLIFDETLHAGTPEPEVLDRIRTCEDSARKVRESVLAHRIVDLSRTGAAVLGLDQTLRALRQGHVRMLLARDGFAKMGYLCPRCGELSLGFNRCPTCNGAMAAIFNVVEEMIQRALDAHCEVVRLLNESVLDNVGHIGAELSGENPTTPSFEVRAVSEKRS
jgi:peptide subunit release factor 1 (eRF1)